MPFIRNGFINVALVVTALLMVHPVRSLLADYQYSRVARVLDDPATEGRDVIAISEASMPRYREAAEALERASALVPARSLYYKASADLHLRLGIWAEVMEGIGAPVPAAAPTRRDAFARTEQDLRAAVSRQPLNPDYRLALGQFYDMIGRPEAGREYVAAVYAAPHNAGLRYAVAMQHLLQGRKKEALDHAAALAAMDDSYVLADSAAKKLIMEQRAPVYASFLSRSYLFKALEIAWRASDQNLEVVRKIVPDTSDGRELMRHFMETRRISE